MACALRKTHPDASSDFPCLNLYYRIGIALALIFAACAIRADPEPKTNGDVFALPPVSPTQIDPRDENLVISKIVFIGNRAIKSEEIEAHIAVFRNRSIQRTALEQLRNSVTQLYIQRGYVNSGAIISDDAFKDGVLSIRIIEGTIADIRIEGIGALNDRYLTGRLIRSGEPLNVNLLEERMRVLLTDPLFEQINARLVPGGELGAAVLDVKAKRAKNYGLAIEASNYQAPAVGSSFASLIGWVRNLTTWGDKFDASVRASEGSNHYDLGWEIPLLGGRTLLNLRAAQGSSSVIE